MIRKALCLPFLAAGACLLLPALALIGLAALVSGEPASVKWGRP